MRRNVGLGLGFLLALPIPVISFAASSPPWIDVLSLTAPFVWAAILGAAVRVAGIGDDALRRMTAEASTAAHAHGVAIDRMTTEASAAGRVHAAEKVTLRSAASSERTERERLETLRGLVDAELALAGLVNRSLLPEDVVLPNVSIAVRQLPCAIVGGDYLHVALPRSDLLYLCVGDVSGHGLAASLVVSRIHGFVQRWTFERRTAVEILEALDEAVLEILEHTNFFMTFAVFRVDLAASEIEFATAGHPPQWLLRADRKTVERLSTGNGLLGMRDARILGDVRSARVAIAPGDVLILFTDGLVEVLPKGSGEMLGAEGLLSSVSKVETRIPAALADEIIRMVTAFGRVGAFEDDVSLMVTRFGPPAASSRDARLAAPSLASP